jgi:hypothetical protein
MFTSCSTPQHIFAETSIFPCAHIDNHRRKITTMKATEITNLEEIVFDVYSLETSFSGD